MSKDNMKRIEELKSDIQANQFQIQNLEEEIERDIQYLVDNTDTFLSLGIITKEDADTLVSLSKQEIDYRETDAFQKILETVAGVKERIDETLDQLKKQRTEITDKQKEV